MATYVWCNACGKKYKLPNPPSPDKKIKCKACGEGQLTVERPEGASPPRDSQVINGKSPKSSRKTSSRQSDASDQEMVQAVGNAYSRMRKEIHKKIIGQELVVERVLTCLFAGGHSLLIGVPGLAKTLLVTSISQALGVSFKRIQFTPDLLPTDITGTDIIQDDPETGRREYKFLAGPVFCNILLADEINRTPPKTQAALLEAMQEKQVSSGGKMYKLDQPFFVLATQNPIDQEGTYPLPEAQMDRFLYNIFVDYPQRDNELKIAEVVTSGVSDEIETVMSGEEIMEYQRLIRRVPVSKHVLQYAVNLVRATRKGGEEAPDFINEYINFGAGPRACLGLISAAKTRAVLHGQYHASTEDVAQVALPVLRHRISPNFGAQAEGITSDKLVNMLLEAVPQNA